jgi:hypothetical protein
MEITLIINVTTNKTSPSAKAERVKELSNS